METLKPTENPAIFGLLKQEYENERYPQEHRDYIKRKIEDGLVSGEVKEKDRNEMWKNYEHLKKHLKSVPNTTNVVQAIEDYIRDISNDENGSFRYPFAHKMLTKIEVEGEKDLQYPPGGLGAHIQEVADYGETLAFGKNGKYKLEGFFSEGEKKDGEKIPPEHYAALLVDVVGPVHDILKFLGSLDAQIMPDHEIMTAALVRDMFIGRTVSLRGKDHILDEDDVEFVAQVIEDHENIGDPSYLREQDRDKYASADNNADRAKSLFFLIDTQTGVFEVGEDGAVVLNEKQLKKRFADLYFRHVAKFVYDDETGQAIKTAKIFRPEWGAYALRDYIALFSQLESSGVVEMPKDWKNILLNTAFEVLEESEREHYELIENGVAKDPKSGESYSFSVEDILQIRATRIELVKQLFSGEEYKLLLDRVLTALSDNEVNNDPKILYFIEEMLLDTISQANIFSGHPDQKNMQQQLVAKILANPFIYKLDHLMHQELFLDEAAKAASEGYNKRHGYSNPEELSHKERSFNLSAFASLQETLGILSERTAQPPEQILKNILEGKVSYDEWVFLVEAQKTTYLGSRIWSGDAFYREAILFDQSSADDKKEDWNQVVDNARLMADWLKVEYNETIHSSLEKFSKQQTFLDENHSDFLNGVTPLLEPEFMMNFTDIEMTDSQMITIRDIYKDEKRDFSEVETKVLSELAANGTELFACLLGLIQLANERKEDPIDILKKLTKAGESEGINLADEDLMMREVLLYKHLMTYQNRIWQKREMEVGLNPSGFSTVTNPNEEVKRMIMMAEKILDFLGQN